MSFKMPLNRRKILDHLDKGGVAAEVGVWRGGYANEILVRAKPSKLYLIDPWKYPDTIVGDPDGGPPAVFNGDKVFESVQARFSGNPEVELRRESSPAAARRFDNQILDFIHIDARHDKVSVWNDLEAWMPKIKPGGYLLGHDYTASGPDNFGVDVALHGFVDKYRHRLGIIFVSDATFVVHIFPRRA